MADIVFLTPDDPPEAFPDPATAPAEFDGLLAVGGDLTPQRLLAAYRRGIFPWYEAGQPILWWSPDPRAVLVPSRLHISRSLRRTLRSDRYRVSIDQAFASVIDACADTRSTSGTWITPDMRAAYLHLHQLGHAHAVETWDGAELVGGLYGIAIGSVFFGESMFSYASDASKVALVKLVRVLESRGIELIDCQVANSHLTSLGSELMPRNDFVRKVENLTQKAGQTDPWHAAPEQTSRLVPAPATPARLRD
ncbi:MAG: leucyl/phenylalanyl-tRNA--protein transferase [Gammaproteobacteria bacterium]|nr:leucyl/phenylalanyl-tRNA--protein transferase [Gammaproteobacteria bacterium]